MIDLRQGDCLELLKDIPDGSVDMVMTDMPYGTTNARWDSVVDLDDMWLQLKRIVKTDGAIVMTAAQPFTTTLISSNMSMFRYDLTWCKTQSTGFYNANRMPLRAHEDICVFYSKLPTYNPQKTDGKPYRQKRGAAAEVYHGQDLHETVSDGKRYPVSYQTVKSEKGLHPTQKPVALMEYLIKTYTNEHDVVIDMFMGSGSTGVACVNTNRRFIGIELDPDYFKIAEERINQAAEKGGFLMPD